MPFSFTRLDLGVAVLTQFIVLCLFQYVTYEDCVKEAYMLAGKCRGDSNDSQLTNVKKNICDEYEKKLRSLCSAHCGKG